MPCAGGASVSGAESGASDYSDRGGGALQCTYQNEEGGRCRQPLRASPRSPVHHHHVAAQRHTSRWSEYRRTGAAHASNC